MFLSQQEISELTGKKRRKLQAAELRYMKVPHYVRSDGSIAIVRDNLKTRPSDKMRIAEPNFEALNRHAQQEHSQPRE